MPSINFSVSFLVRTAADYLAMFSDVLKLNPGLKGDIEREIRWAKNTLKKNDRIVWYLRYVRFSALISLSKGTLLGQGTLEAIEPAKKLLEKSVAYYQSKGDNPWPARWTIRGIRGNLEHFLGLQYGPIQDLVFAWQSADNLFETFRKLEQDMKDKLSEDDRKLEPQEGDELVLDCGGGWAWWQLSRAFCTAEAKAMGHCGNEGSQDPNERILSLRQKEMRGGKTYYVPYLTFIINDGWLGEMKGRNNDKPVARYFPYIVKLLESDLVTGINGGGYLPEHNFDITDLPEATQKKLYDKKSGLMPLDLEYRTYGASPELAARVSKRLNLESFNQKWVPEEKGFFIEEHTLKEFVKSFGNDGAEFALDVVTSGLPESNDHYSKPADIYRSLDSKSQDLIGDYVLQHYVEQAHAYEMVLKEDDPEAEFYVDDEDQMATFIEENDLPDLEMFLTGAYQIGYESGAYELALKDLADALYDGGYHPFKLKFDKKQLSDPESKIEVYLPLDAAIETIDKGEIIDHLEQDFSLTVDREDYSDNFQWSAVNQSIQDELTPKKEKSVEPQAVIAAEEADPFARYERFFARKGWKVVPCPLRDNRWWTNGTANVELHTKEGKLLWKHHGNFISRGEGLGSLTLAVMENHDKSPKTSAEEDDPFAKYEKLLDRLGWILVQGKSEGTYSWKRWTSSWMSTAASFMVYHDTDTRSDEDETIPGYTETSWLLTMDGHRNTRGTGLGALIIALQGNGFETHKTGAAEHYGPVYHGGTFDAGENKYHPAGKVLYTTRDKDAAQTYVQMHEERFGPGAELKSLYSRATHPASWNLISKAAISVGIDPEEGTPASVFDSEMHGEDKVIKLVKLLLDKGYDSANLPDIPYGGRGSEIEAHILLNKNMVSPATPKTGSEELDARYTKWFERKGWELIDEEQHSAQCAGDPYSWKTWGSPESIRGGCRYKVRVTCDLTREENPLRWIFLDKTDPNNHEMVRGNEYSALMIAIHGNDSKTSAAEEVAENDATITKIISYLTRKGYVHQVTTKTHYEGHELEEEVFDPPFNDEELNKVLAEVMVRRRYTHGQVLQIALADWYLRTRPIAARSALITTPPKAGNGLGSLIVALNLLTDPENQKSMTRYAAEERADNEDSVEKIEAYLKRKGFVAMDEQPHSFDDFKVIDTLYSPHSLDVEKRYGWDLRWVRVRRRIMHHTNIVSDLVSDWSLALNSSRDKLERQLINPLEYTVGNGVGSLILALNSLSDPDNRKSSSHKVAVNQSFPLVEKIDAFLTKKGLPHQRHVSILRDQPFGQNVRFYIGKDLYDLYEDLDRLDDPYEDIDDGSIPGIECIRVWGFDVTEETVNEETGEIMEPPQWAIVEKSDGWNGDTEKAGGTTYAEFVAKFMELFEH
jgi:hypothetical protein